MIGTITYTIDIQGMDCTSCAQTVEKGVTRLPGVQQCEVNFTTEKLTVTGNASRETVIAQVRELGYDVKQESLETVTAVTPSPYSLFPIHVGTLGYSSGVIRCIANFAWAFSGGNRRYGTGR